MKRTFFTHVFLAPHKSLGSRLLVLFVIFVAIIGTILGIIAYQITSKALIRQAEMSSEQTITLAGEKLELKQQFLVNLSNQLVLNRFFTEHLFQIAIPELGEDERSRRLAEMRTMLGQLALSDASIRDITLIPLEDKLPLISTNLEVQQQFDKFQPWIDEIRQKEGAPHWLPVSQQGYLGDSSKPVIAYGKLLGKQNMGSNDFVLLVQIEAAILEEMIDNISLSSSGSAVVLDQKMNRMTMVGTNNDWSSTSEILAKLNGSGTMVQDDQLLVYHKSSFSDWSVIGSAPVDELTVAAKSIQTVTLGVVVGSILIAILIGLYLGMSISRPLEQLEQFMSLAALGDFRGRMKEYRRDELGRVALAYNKMVQQIGNLVHDVNKSVNQLSISSERISDAAQQTAQSANEISIASEHIASGAASLAQNAEHGAAEVTGMERRLREVLEFQQSMNESAQIGYDISDEADKLARQLLEKTEETKRRFYTIDERMQNLQDVTQSIHHLLQLMQQLSKQIKVLSLNAAIEAVRAGSVGNGFKVIADEIRILAEQSNLSLVNVEQLTAAIGLEVSLSTEAVNDTMPIYQEMAEEVYNVHQRIHQNQDRMSNILLHCKEMNDAIIELNHMHRVMSESIVEVSAVSQEASSTTEQVSSLCQVQSSIGNGLIQQVAGLNEVTLRLEKQMQLFKL